MPMDKKGTIFSDNAKLSARGNVKSVAYFGRSRPPISISSFRMFKASNPSNCSGTWATPGDIKLTSNGGGLCGHSAPASSSFLRSVQLASCAPVLYTVRHSKCLKWPVTNETRYTRGWEQSAVAPNRPTLKTLMHVGPGTRFVRQRERVVRVARRRVAQNQPKRCSGRDSDLVCQNPRFQPL
jgi:hypothetical protein